MVDRSISIFLEALEKNSPEQRVAFLNEACGNDSELRKRVEILLSAHEDAGSFLEKPPEELAATAGADAHIADLLLLSAGDAIHAVPASQVQLTHQPANDPAKKIFSVAWEPSPETLLADGKVGARLQAAAFGRIARQQQGQEGEDYAHRPGEDP